VIFGAHEETTIRGLQQADLSPTFSLAHPGSFKITKLAKTVRGAIEMGYFTEGQFEEAKAGFNEAISQTR
jgi:hypothetical protein